MTSQPKTLEVLYEDNHCLVVCKPARLLTGSDKTGDETLLQLVREYNGARQEAGKKGYVAPLHFLDRPVSGVVMYALSSKAAARLSAQFREARIEKIYRAIVEPGPGVNPTGGKLDDYLLKDHDTNLVTVATAGTPGAKLSTLSYKHLGTEGALALVEVRPKTGRSHQIRVQLSSRGMPIYGDRKYGAKETWDGRIALHALRVHFEHPVSKKEIVVTAPIPDAWREIWCGDLHVQEA